MTEEQRQLVEQAQESVAAARLLLSAGHDGFAASRAYYAMFYVAEAFLLTKGLAFSKHGAVHAAFGQHFVKTGIVPPEHHRRLVKAMAVRHAADYGAVGGVTAKEAEEQIRHAEEFIELAVGCLDLGEGS